MVSIDDLMTIEEIETGIGIAHAIGIEIEVILMGVMTVVVGIVVEAVVDKAPIAEVLEVHQSQVEPSCLIASDFLVWNI